MIANPEASNQRLICYVDISHLQGGYPGDTHMHTYIVHISTVFSCSPFHGHYSQNMPESARMIINNLYSCSR